MPTVWENPTPASENRPFGSSKYAPLSEDLRRNPGHWAVLRDYDLGTTSIGAAIRRGEYVAFRPEGSFEALTRRIVNDQGVKVQRVYVRYVGTPGSPERARVEEMDRRAREGGR